MHLYSLGCCGEQMINRGIRGLSEEDAYDRNVVFPTPTSPRIRTVISGGSVILCAKDVGNEALSTMKGR